MQQKSVMSRHRLLPLLATLVVLALPGYTLVQSAGAGTTSTVHQVPSSIDRTGATDVSSAINAFIASVPDGSTIVFPQGARYRIEGAVLIGARHHLTIEGSGATFFATTNGSAAKPGGPNAVMQHWPRHRDQWLVYDSSYIVVRNIVIHGPNVNGGTADNAYVLAYEAQAGFEFYDTSYSSLEHCSISYTYGDLVYIGNRASNDVVQACTLSSSGRQGVTVAYANNVVIEHNSLQNIRRSAIDLEPFTATWGVTNVWIVYNTFKWIRLDTIAAKAQGDVSRILIAYNKLTSEPLSIRNTPDAVITPPRHDWYVVGNVSDTMFGSPHGAYWITYTKNVTVKGNFQPLQAGRGQIAVQSTGSTNVQVSGNSFPQI
jgi:parallel beta helix pectate lyase-like protein